MGSVDITNVLPISDIHDLDVRVDRDKQEEIVSVVGGEELRGVVTGGFFFKILRGDNSITCKGIWAYVAVMEYLDGRSSSSSPSGTSS